MMLFYMFLLGVPLCMAYVDEWGYECPDTWSFDLDSKTCVKEFNVKKRWLQARLACRAEGGDLAMIKNGRITNTVKILLQSRKRYWMGMSDDDNDGVYHYVDGTAVSRFNRWAASEPSNHGGIEKCVEMIGNNRGSWNDKKCSKKRYYICQVPAHMMLECPPSWKLYEDVKLCVMAYPHKESWATARRTCHHAGGDLLKVADKHMSQFVRDLLSKRTRYWVGAHDPDERGPGPWRYLDGERVSTFARWARKEPNNHRGNEWCIEVYGNRRVSWNDKRCTRRRNFVCQKMADVAKEFISTQKPALETTTELVTFVTR